MCHEVLLQLEQLAMFFGLEFCLCGKHLSSNLWRIDSALGWPHFASPIHELLRNIHSSFTLVITHCIGLSQHLIVFFLNRCSILDDRYPLTQSICLNCILILILLCCALVLLHEGSILKFSGILFSNSFLDVSHALPLIDIVIFIWLLEIRWLLYHLLWVSVPLYARVILLALVHVNWDNLVLLLSRGMILQSI